MSSLPRAGKRGPCKLCRQQAVFWLTQGRRGGRRARRALAARPPQGRRRHRRRFHCPCSRRPAPAPSRPGARLRGRRALPRCSGRGRRPRGRRRVRVLRSMGNGRLAWRLRTADPATCPSPDGHYRDPAAPRAFHTLAAGGLVGCGTDRSRLRASQPD